MPSTPPSTVTRVLPWLALSMPPLLWAGNFIVGRAVRADMTPMTLSLGRWFIALFCILPFGLASMRRDVMRYWKHRWLVLGTSATGMVAFNSLVYVGLQTTSASNALLLNSLIPLLIVMLGAAIYRQRLEIGQVVGLVLSFAGVLTLALHGQWSQWHHVAFVPGDGLVLIAMVCFALFTLWLRKLPSDLDRTGLMGIQIVVALIVLVPFWLAEPSGGATMRLSWGVVGALLYVGIFPSVLAYLLYMRAVQYFGAARAGLSIHLIPVFGVTLSALILHERLYVWHAWGIAAIAAGLICSNLRQAPKALAC